MSIWMLILMAWTVVNFKIIQVISTSRVDVNNDK